MTQSSEHPSDPGTSEDSYLQEMLSPGRRILRSFARVMLATTVVATLGVAVFAYQYLVGLGIFNITDAQLSTIVNYQPSDNTIVFDRDDRKIGEYFSRYHVFVPYREMPKVFIDALVAVEDRNFFSHFGVDFRGITRALVANLKGKTYEQGASTITQQLVRHFLLSKEKTIDRKIKEAALAIQLERKLSKQKILEVYANALFLGNGSYGIGAAARRYFGKSLAKLAPHELALIAGLFQSPSRYNPVKYPERAKNRQLQVIRAMLRARKIGIEEARAMAKAPLKYHDYRPSNMSLAPHFVDYVQEVTEGILEHGVKNQGLRIYTTLDPTLQASANAAFVEAEPHLSSTEKLLPKAAEPKGYLIEAAMLVTDPKSGAILAMVGGRDYRTSQFNRSVASLRSPGSAFKPIIFSKALATRWNWSDVVYVAPVALGDYKPRNHSNSFLTETTLLRALYKSINTPAVEIGNKIGLSEVLDHARLLGIKTPIRQEAGSLLGGSEVTLADLNTVYATFANGGKRVEPYGIRKITDRKGRVLFEAKPTDARAEQVLSEQVAYLMVEGLRSVFSHGTAASAPEWAEWAGGKTGTSNDSRDNWFVGFTNNTVATVWVGTDVASGITGNAAGNTLALPIWDSFMKKAVRHRPAEAFPVPTGIVSHKVNPRFGNIDPTGIPMFFMEGREPRAARSDLQEISQSGGYRNLFDY